MSPGDEHGLGTAETVVLGLASMLGAGVYAVWGAAAAAAGDLVVLAVVLAGVVAVCSAGSAADLAVDCPRGSGCGYAAGVAWLGPGVGRLAGVASLVGRSASAAAAAGVFGRYVLPSASVPAALLAVLAVTALNIAGVRWTARSAYALVGGTLMVLLVVAVVGLTGRGEPADVAAPPAVSIVVDRGPLGVLTAAGLVFFAFTGYSRIAALGPETRDPRRTVRPAVGIALAVVFVVYLLVAWSLQVGLGVDGLAGQVAPLAALVDTRGEPGLGVLVRVGAAVATGSALLAALVGASRTAAAMAGGRDLPRVLARTGRRGGPWVADLAGAAVAAGTAALAGPDAAIAIAACAALVYYGVVNLAALRLPAQARARPRVAAVMSMAGLVLCLLLAVLLPLAQVLITGAALAVGWTACTFLPHRR